MNIQSLTRLSAVILILGFSQVPAQSTLAPMEKEPMNAQAVAIRCLTPETPPQAMDIIGFWLAAGPRLWFAKDADFDRRFRDRYASLYEAASRGALSEWQKTPDGTLALIILLDQYPRNAFRNTPQMYATDEMAREVAESAIAVDYDQAIPTGLRRFIYLPFGHSEDLADQERSVGLFKTLNPSDVAHAEHHRDLVRRFGRFPHRNEILGRVSTAEEQRYLDEGGYRG